MAFTRRVGPSWSISTIVRTNAHGRNSEKTQPRRGGDEGGCDDPDECTEGEEGAVACGQEGSAAIQSQLCVDGRWLAEGACVCEHESEAYDPLSDACLPSNPCLEDGLPYGGGNGTASEPYRICSKDHLQNVSDALGAHFILARSLDLSGGGPRGNEQQRRHHHR
jgi:hypothetical protein